MTLPDGFIKMLKGYGFAPFDALPDVLASTDAVTAVRVNPAKPGYIPPENTTGVPWCREGLILESRPVFTLDTALHQGLYYVQDPSSMFLSHILRQITGDEPINYLDACAAPGGKTTCAISALPTGSTVTANEAVPSRAAILRENLIKWGYPSVTITRGDARAISDSGIKWDIISADVPCSGEGMMRKEPEAVAQWSNRLIKDCRSKQLEIVDSLWQALIPGGYLIYSTCTFNRCENEEVIEHLVDNLGACPVEIAIGRDWNIATGIDTTLPCYRFIPGLIQGEGLFMAVVRKPGQGRVKAGRPPHTAKIDAKVASWVANPSEMTFSTSPDGRINAFPASGAWLPDALIHTRGVDVIHHGVTIATMKGRDFIPAHSLAMSTALEKAAFPTIEIDNATALDYLRCEPIALPSDTPIGHVLLTHCDRPLGFIKNLGKRANGMYPREWRIRCL